MKKYLAEGLVIFASIFASFSVENIRQNSIEKEILNEAVITLGDEIESNIKYTKEHLKQVKNFHYVMESIFNNFENISMNDIYNLHSSNPYIFRIIENFVGCEMGNGEKCESEKLKKFPLRGQTASGNAKC